MILKINFKVFAMPHENPLCLPLTLSEECYIQRITSMSEGFFEGVGIVRRNPRKRVLKFMSSMRKRKGQPRGMRCI